MVLLEYHVINSVPKFPCIRIYWVSNMYPTFRTGAANARICSIIDQEAIIGIDDEFNVWKLDRLSFWRENKTIL